LCCFGLCCDQDQRCCDDGGGEGLCCAVDETCCPGDGVANCCSSDETCCAGLCCAAGEECKGGQCCSATAGVSGLRGGSHVQVDVAVQDRLAGLAKIEGYAGVYNCTMNIPSFGYGTKDPVVCTMTKLDPRDDASFRMWPTGAGDDDSCGCGSEMISRLRLNVGSWVRQSISGIYMDNHVVTIRNGDPGLSRLTIQVNGKRRAPLTLATNDLQNIDVRADMVPGPNNTIAVEGEGDLGAAALVVFQSDRSGQIRVFPNELERSHQNLDWNTTSDAGAPYVNSGKIESTSDQRGAASATQTIYLTFASMLDLSAASDPKHYRVAVNSQEVKVAGIESQIVGAGVRVVLRLADGSLTAGDQVIVSWDELLDAVDRPLWGDIGPLTAK
jgi:hypothetical protein